MSDFLPARRLISCLVHTMLKSRLLLVTLFFMLVFGYLPAASAQAAAPAAAASGQAAPLCLPGIYPYDPGDCLAAGPSAYLTNMASKGLTFPAQPLATLRPDPELGVVPVRYAEVVTKNAPIYGSLQDAISKNRKGAVQYLNGDFMFVSYTEEQQINGKKLYMVSPGAYMTGADLSRLGVLPRFQGLLFNQTPRTSFGWVMTHWGPSPLYTKRTPGDQGADTSHGLLLYDIVPIYAVERVENEDWYMVGPDEWVSKKYIAMVTPNTTPPAGVTGDRWIEVNLYTQTLAVYDQRQLVFATMIASGADPFWTRPGTFQIYEKYELTLMRGAAESGGDAYYLEDVPWTLYYDGARALHGAYWRAKLGFAQSHGCVNMTTGDSHWVFDWAQIGDWVYVWDPSGQTPTDPSLYGSGGY